MRRRCYDPKEPAFRYYGARGITVCDRWRHSFASFLEDMGKRPSRQHQIDRINNDGPYSPENCRWATRRTQLDNRRNTVLVTFRGVSRTVPEWARQMGLKKLALWTRLFVLGWSVESALTLPAGQKRGANGVHP